MWWSNKKYYCEIHRSLTREFHLAATKNWLRRDKSTKMTKFRAFSLPVCLLVMCCISTLVNSIPQQWTRQRRQDEAATSTTRTTTSSTTTTTPSTVVAPINPKVRSKKLSSLLKNGNSTSIKNVNIKLENVNITAMLDMDKIELTPEFLENTMNDYMVSDMVSYFEAAHTRSLVRIS